MYIAKQMMCFASAFFGPLTLLYRVGKLRSLVLNFYTLKILEIILLFPVFYFRLHFLSDLKNVKIFTQAKFFIPKFLLETTYF